MPSDQDENRASWQDAGTVNWADSVDRNMQSQVYDQSSGDVLDAIDTDDLDFLSPDTTSDLPGQWQRQPLVSKETLGTFARQISPALVPLPCALVIFLLTCVLPSAGQTFLPPLATGILLLLLTFLQGGLLYFAGSNDTLWLLYVAGGYALFLLGGVFAAFGPLVALVTLLLVVVAGALLARRGIHPTKEGYVDLVELFGKYTHTLYPGLNLLLPWEKVSQRLNTQEVTWTAPSQLIPTSRDQDVELTATLSYQLIAEDAHLVALTVKDWESSLQVLFIGTLQSVMNQLSPDDFLTWTQSIYTTPVASQASAFDPTVATRWDLINNSLSRRIQDQVAAWGVQINWVRIQDLTLLPHTHIRHQAAGTGGTTQIVKNELPMEPTRSVALASSASIPKVVEKPESASFVTPALTPAPASATKIPMPTNMAASVETLVEAYNAVRIGNITEPAMMLDIAQRFDELAKDMVLNQAINFDASRAASTLRERALKLQELSQARAGTSSS